MADLPVKAPGKLPPWAIVAAGGIGLFFAFGFLNSKGSSGGASGVQAQPDLTGVAQDLVDALAAQVSPETQPGSVQAATAGHVQANSSGAVSTSKGGSGHKGGSSTAAVTPSPPVVTAHAVFFPGLGYVSTPAWEGSNARFGSGEAID